MKLFLGQNEIKYLKLSRINNIDSFNNTSIKISPPDISQEKVRIPARSSDIEIRYFIFRIAQIIIIICYFINLTIKIDYFYNLK